jgi:hypothetical protein
VEKIALSADHLIVCKNIITNVSNSNIDQIEKVYIIEACSCLINGNNLAAATMLGCAIERVIILLANSYLNYLSNGIGTEQEINNFTQKVINKKNASERLTGLMKYIEPQKELFDKNGFENSAEHLGAFHFIREMRNDAGHPSGKVISESELFGHLIYYNNIFTKTHTIMDFLNKQKR